LLSLNGVLFTERSLMGMVPPACWPVKSPEAMTVTEALGVDQQVVMVLGVAAPG
jgi:hypothetical protein